MLKSFLVNFISLTLMTDRFWTSNIALKISKTVPVDPHLVLSYTLRLELTGYGQERGLSGFFLKFNITLLELFLSHVIYNSM